MDLVLERYSNRLSPPLLFRLALHRGSLDAQRQHRNLSSALRLFVLEYYRRKAA